MPTELYWDLVLQQMGMNWDYHQGIMKIPMIGFINNQILYYKILKVPWGSR
jgi:hypothetical protein